MLTQSLISIQILLKHLISLKWLFKGSNIKCLDLYDKTVLIVPSVNGEQHEEFACYVLESNSF